MSEDIALALAGGGVERVFAVPGGGSSLDLLDALDRTGTEVVTPHHESAAIVMAAVAHRVTGHVGAATTIKGPGVANSLPGVACARLERWPVVSFSEAFPPGADSALVHKRIDHGRLIGGAAKAHGICAGGDDVAAAIELAVEDEPGPVMLDLLPGTVVSERRLGDPAQGGADSTHDAETVHRLVASAERPLVIVGTLGFRHPVREQLEALQVPVMTTAAAKGVVDELGSMAAGVYTGVGLDLAPERHLLVEADLVIGFGLRSNELLKSTVHGVPTVLVDDHAGELSPGIDATATAAAAEFGRVLEALGSVSWGEDLVASLLERVESDLGSLGFTPATALPEVQRLLGPACRLVVDTGDFCTVAEHLWRSSRTSGYLGTGQSRYMGMGIPMAIGAGLADPTIPTVLAVGDGGIGPHFGEFSLAVQRQLPLLVIFLTDGGMSSIIGRALATGKTMKFLERPDEQWAAAAGGLGFESMTATDSASLSDAVETWMPASGPRFIACPFSPNAYRSMSTTLR
jgi:acetolactate synthase-1/2/3 large subunit